MTRVDVMKRAASALWWGVMFATLARHRVTGQLAVRVPLVALGTEIIVEPKGEES